ncbi:MAG: RNA polymerase factor sigma-32 [Bdellovibrionales bacterium]
MPHFLSFGIIHERTRPMAFTDVAPAQLNYIKTAMNEALLSRDYEQELAIRWRALGDKQAMHALIRAHTRLVVSIASKFKLYGLPLGDLIQEGNIGLMLAVNKFDPEREVRFSTYAAWWIKAQIQDYILRNWSIVRTGTTAAHKSLFFNLRRLRAQIAGRSDGAEYDGHLSTDTRLEIAKTLGVAVSDVEAMETRMGSPDQSMSAPIGNDSEGQTREWGDTLADTAPTPEESIMRSHDTKVRNGCLQNALSQLDTREREIITQRRLQDEEDSMTLEALGTHLGVSKERVRQLEARALEKLKAAITNCAKRHQDFYQAA